MVGSYLNNSLKEKYNNHLDNKYCNAKKKKIKRKIKTFLVIPFT